MWNTAGELAMILFLGYVIAGINPGSGQNIMPENMTGSINVTNSTGPGSASLAKHMGEALKALESGNNEAALTHLTAAQQAIALSECEQAKIHFNETMMAFSLGDSKSALKHLKAANNALD
jgi:hypothetical protein